jgi:hypothetical protein
MAQNTIKTARDHGTISGKFSILTTGLAVLEKKVETAGGGRYQFGLFSHDFCRVVFGGFIVNSDDCSVEFMRLRNELNSEFIKRWGVSLDEIEKKALLQNELNARIKLALFVLYNGQKMAEKASYVFPQRGQMFDYTEYRLYFPQEDGIDTPITHCILPGYFVDQVRYDMPSVTTRDLSFNRKVFTTKTAVQEPIAAPVSSTSILTSISRNTISQARYNPDVTTVLLTQPIEQGKIKRVERSRCCIVQ